MYRVKWKFYTWEGEESKDELKHLIDEYIVRKNKEKQGKTLLPTIPLHYGENSNEVSNKVVDITINQGKVSRKVKVKSELPILNKNTKKTDRAPTIQSVSKSKQPNKAQNCDKTNATVPIPTSSVQSRKNLEDIGVLVNNIQVEDSMDITENIISPTDSAADECVFSELSDADFQVQPSEKTIESPAKRTDVDIETDEQHENSSTDLIASRKHKQACAEEALTPVVKSSEESFLKTLKLDLSLRVKPIVLMADDTKMQSETYKEFDFANTLAKAKVRYL